MTGGEFGREMGTEILETGKEAHGKGIEKDGE